MADSQITLLFPSVGRRVELLQAFRAAAARQSVALRIIATDCTKTAPAFHCADEAHLVPLISDQGYVPTLLGIAGKTGARALIPTIDTDLPILSNVREQFDALGCTALIGDAHAIAVCRDKRLTFRFLRDHRFDTPQTWDGPEIACTQFAQFPLFIKPRSGSSSHAVHKVNDAEELAFFLKRVPDAIVQEFIPGKEVTLDAYVGLGGEVRCVVPRLRWQVRAGEVSKGVVIKDPGLMDATRNVVQTLSRSFRGVVTVQCIVDGDKRRFIEINPRFGGGAPLSVAAGADFPGWLLSELRGVAPDIAFDGFRPGVCMLRYDWSLFADTDSAGNVSRASTATIWPGFST